MQLTDTGAVPRRCWVESISLAGFFAAVAAMFVSSGESAVVPWINHDAANALYIGGRVLHGDVLYVDWHYFVMPPVVVWSAGIRWITELSGLSPVTVFHAVFVVTTSA